jgi:hypothetical protein
MKRILEFINNNEKIKKINMIDNFLFFDEKWMFVENEDFYKDQLDEIEKINLNIKEFIKLGINIANKLNNLNIDVLDYDVNNLEKYLNL